MLLVRIENGICKPSFFCTKKFFAIMAKQKMFFACRKFNVKSREYNKLANLLKDSDAKLQGLCMHQHI